MTSDESSVEPTAPVGEPVQTSTTGEPVAAEAALQWDKSEQPAKKAAKGDKAGDKVAARAATNLAPPSLDQLMASRAVHWRHDEKPLLTLEAVREWVNRCGLLVYGPRAQQLGAPAPSLVEATLGKKLGPDAEPSGMEAARSLLARLVAEGGAVPLNLLGAAGGLGTDVPDYVASAAVFSYIFTLRGNKAWKQAPVTAGAVKVSPLALATYEMLSAKVMMSAYDLATQLGKEVTEGAVLRALTELWGQLRVVPVVQESGATLWELTTARFTKQIKAGANAGQPSALSALISLYLGQAIAATEDEIETFLSPLAARSRVRDVIHALLSARQLETVAVEGKTLLHVGGELPEFTVTTAVEVEEGEGEGSGSRISKFAGKPASKIGTGLRSKPTGKGQFAGKPPFAKKPGFGDRERRPFQQAGRPSGQTAGGAEARPRFDKPWGEERKPRVERAAGAGRPDRGGSQPVQGARHESAPARREYTPRPRPESGDTARRTFSKPGTFGRKREGVAAEARPSGREFGGGQGGAPRREAGGEGARAPRREFGERPERGERPAAGGFKRASAGSYAARPKTRFGGRPAAAERPSFGTKPGSSGDRGAVGGAEAPRKLYRKFDAPRDKKPFTPRVVEGKSFGAKRASTGPERPARSFEGSRPAGARPAAPRSEAGSDSRGGKKPFVRTGGEFAAGGGPFAKFADGKKPFRKPGPGKKSAGGRSAGGFKPTQRKRPEGNGPR